MISKLFYILLFLFSLSLLSSVNINKANLKELKSLPRIGKKKAIAIIEYRKLNGKFKNIEELSRVHGIGKKTVKNLSNLISVTDDLNQTDKENQEDIIEEVTDPGGKININIASEGELLMLPGIGKVKVLKIVDYRKKHYFSKISDIKNVKGIGEKNFEKISGFITVKIDVNSISSKQLMKLTTINENFIKEIIFYKNKKIKITNSFLKKKFKKYNLKKDTINLFYLPKIEEESNEFVEHQ